jgi:hypothetical protein
VDNIDKSFDDYFLNISDHGIFVTYWPFAAWAPEYRYSLSLVSNTFRLEYRFNGVVLQLNL